MGQRLVISVFENSASYSDNPIARIYYHWSAYTVSAFEEAKELLDTYYLDEDISKIGDTRVRLLRSVEKHGGGISGGLKGDEIKEIKQSQGLISLVNCECNNISRNCGLIAFTKTGMDNLENASEGDLDLILDNDIDDATVINYVYSHYDNFDEIKEFYDDLEETEVHEIPFDLDGEFSYSELEEAVDFLNNNNEYVFKRRGDYFEIVA